MNTIFVTRRERFNAAHKMWNPKWSEAKNIEVFGKCSNKNWHGHNYELFVTVKGPPNEDTGYCADLKEVSKIVKKKAIEKLDHKNINLDVDFMHGKLASTENMAIAIWEQIEQGITDLGVTLHCVKLCETENNFVEYFG